MTTIQHDYSSIMAAISAPENRTKFIIVRDGVTHRITSGYSVVYTPGTGQIKIAFSPSEKFYIQPSDTIAVED